jgi:glycerophosphocholine phosphodiesterase GPCPD1
MKQTRYPLLFLTQGKTDKWPAYFDPRTQSVEMAAYTALSIGFSGVNIHAEDLLKDRSLIGMIKKWNLILFVWGDDLNDKGVIKQLKIDGVDGVVYDKVDEYREHHEPVFVADSSADRKAILNMITSSGNNDLLTASSAFSWASSGVSTASDVSPMDSSRTDTVILQQISVE